jgi:hypothetical protein
MEWLTPASDNPNSELAALPVAPPVQPSFVDRAKAFTSSLLQSAAPAPRDRYSSVVDMIPALERSGDFAVNAKSKASGRYQITPATAETFGADYARLSDPQYARGVAAQIVPRYAHLIGSDAPDDILAAYNWGPGNVKKWIAAGRPDALLPAETRNYIARSHGLANFPASKPLEALAETADTSAIDEISSPGFLHSLGANFSAGQSEGEEVDNTNADQRALGDAYGDLTEQVNRLSPPDRQFTNPVLTQPLQTRPFGGAPPNTSKDAFWQQVARLKQSDPGATANLPASEAEFKAQVRDRQRQALFGAQEEAARSGPVARMAGQFAGRAVAGFEDPVNLLAMGMGAGASSSLLRTFVIEGALNAGADAVSLPDRLARTERLGAPPPSGEDIATELGTDFLIGGALPTGIKAIGHSLPALVHHFDTRFADAGDNARAARNAVADQARREADNPHTDDEAGRDAYRRDLARTAAALDAGVALPDTSPLHAGARALDPKIAAEKRRATVLQSFHTDELATDAAAMQYKRGGDAEGITDRLQGVTEWDPVSAGVLTVWERNDGTHIVANGHQRVGLARRLEADGHPPIDHAGYVFREADGWRAEDMRVMAALTNMREGSGEAIDAAQILRQAPDKDFGLPPKSALVKRARDLTNLKGTAWDMAWNGAVNERDAAIVGHYAKEEPVQVALLAYVARAHTATAEETELIVRQALAAGAQTEVQTDMFGDLLKANLVLPERIAILKSSLTQLRRDRALFNTLVSKENAIADAGNVLNPEENARRQLQANTVFATLKALAERKGPVSDALQSAAEQSLKGGGRRDATRQFLADVRERVGEGLDRLGDDGQPFRAGDAAPETAAADAGEPDAGATSLFSTEQRDQLDAFADPSKREAFDQQSKDLARELAPEVQKRTEKPAPSNETAKSDAPEFGEAQPEIEALRAMPDGMIAPDQAQYGLFSPDSEGVTVKEVRTEIEREASAVERLRGCIEGGNE